MAIWHFEFFIISKTKKDFKDDSVMEFEQKISWKNLELNEDSLNKLKEIFPFTKSWSEDIKQYGSSEKTNLEFYYEGNTLLEISCRIDIRNVSVDELDIILFFMNKNEAMIFKDTQCYKANNKELKNLIISSDSFRFCKNPKKFLEELCRNG